MVDVCFKNFIEEHSSVILFRQRKKLQLLLL